MYVGQDMLVLGRRKTVLSEQKSYPIKNNRNQLVSPTVTDTKLTWLITTVTLIFRTALLEFNVHQVPREALFKHRLLGSLQVLI